MMRTDDPLNQLNKIMKINKAFIDVLKYNLDVKEVKELILIYMLKLLLSSIRFIYQIH